MAYDRLTKEELIKLLKQRDEAIRKLQMMIKKLRYYSNTDNVTRVLNRREGLRRLNKEIKVCKNNNNTLSVCFVDVDKLKNINDQYGHLEGDNVLRYICKVVRKNIRKEDFLFRIGGDEFIIVFPNTNVDSAKIIMDRISNQISEEGNFVDYNAGISYGFSQYDSEDNEEKVVLKNLIACADEKMYNNKRKKHKDTEFSRKEING